MVTRERLLPQDQWEVLIPDHHPGYLSWDAYQDNQARLRANYKAPRGDGGGAARKGAALLSGLVRCGKCGRMMQVGYSGHGGDAPRYVCGRGTQLYGTPPCQSIGGVYLHHAVLGQLFQVLQPASLEATAHAMADAEHRHREQVAAFETALDRARFEADRALRKHDEVEPGNRLVARTLEARLEERLAAVARAEAALAAARARHPVQLTGEELAWLKRAGADVRAVFDAPATTNSQRKQLIRAVISEITLTIDRQSRTCDVLVAWQGTATTAVTVALPRRGAGAITTGEDTLDLVGAWPPSTTTPRSRRSWAASSAAPRPGWPGPATGSAACAAPTASRTAPSRTQMSVAAATMRSWPASRKPRSSSASTRPPSTGGCETGSSPASSSPLARPGGSVSTRQLRDRIRPDVPDGWLPLEQAAKVLGMARQTVLHKVQRGQLNAVYLTTGRRKGLRIQVEHDQPGLFDTPDERKAQC